jgi:hypothetical protein
MNGRGGGRRQPATPSPSPESRPAETAGGIAGVLAATGLAIYEAAAGGPPDKAIVSAVLFAVGVVPLASTYRVRRSEERTDEAQAGDEGREPAPPESVERSRRNPDTRGPASTLAHNPSETGSSVTGAVAAVLVSVFDVTDQALIAALPALVGAVPTALTWLVAPRMRAARLQAEYDLLRGEILPLKTERARLDARNDMLREENDRLRSSVSASRP